MEKGLLFFTLSVGCVWLVLDEFFGTQRLSSIVKNLTPQMQSPIDKFVNGTLTDEEKQQQKQDVKDAVDNNDAIRTEDAKKAVKEAIDKIYDPNNKGGVNGDGIY